MNKKTKTIVVLLVILIVSLVGFIIYKRQNQEEEAYKPNIYFYPTKDIRLTVKLDFPKGGRITKSIPAYRDNWIVNIDRNGLIEKKYEYLFYESSQPDEWQEKTGWVIQKDSLEKFFINNMTEYGFNNKEIKDFTDYWIPRLIIYPYYKIYPQEDNEINNLISLKLSIQPDNIMRLFYLIEGINEPSSVINHTIQRKFKRNGFHVAEWGVVIKK